MLHNLLRLASCPVQVIINPRYEISVKAIDEDGKVIAFGKTFKKYPHEDE